MGDQPGAGGRDHGRVATRVVKMLMGVEDLGNLPALDPRGGECFFMVERVDREGLAGFGTGHKVVEVAVGVCSPDAFDDHAGLQWQMDSGLALAGHMFAPNDPSKDDARAVH